MSGGETFHHYLPVDDQGIDWGIYVTGAGRVAIRPGQAYPPPGHPGPYDFRWESGRTLPEFQVLLVTRGRGGFESRETGAVTIGDGSLMFLFPGVWHRYQPDPRTGWTERWLSLNGELVHRFMDHGPIDVGSAVRRARGPEDVEKAFDRLLGNIHNNPSQNSLLLSLHAMSLLATAIEAAVYEQPAPTSSSPERSDLADRIVAEAVEFIWTRSHYPITVPRIAEALGVNRRTLERRFAAERGQSILEEINACRLSRAKRLLEETDLPIKVVTHLAGFSSEQRMRATFLAREGILPSDHRSRAAARSRAPG
ncbi:MAG: AraC family transcriptional regulator [Thermoguttaceae bacterium]